MHPLNLALRFGLELAALAGFGWLAWTATQGWMRPLAVVAAVTAAAALWAIFNVPGDPSRSGAAPVVVPGLVRLALELLVLFGGALAFHLAGQTPVAVILATLIVLHYALSTDRIAWLLRN